MEKEFKETTFGKLLDRFATNGEIGSMSHTVEVKTMVIGGAILLGVGILFLTIKKYIFKS